MAIVVAPAAPANGIAAASVPHAPAAARGTVPLVEVVATARKGARETAPRKANADEETIMMAVEDRATIVVLMASNATKAVDRAADVMGIAAAKLPPSDPSSP